MEVPINKDFILIVTDDDVCLFLCGFVLGAISYMGVFGY